MAEQSLHMTETEAAAKSVRIPSLPGKQPGAAQVDVDSDSYQAGARATAAEFRTELAEQEARHEAFMQGVGEMLSEMDQRYRREYLSLVERLFAAVAPTLAKRSSLVDIMKIVEDRAVRENAGLTLRVHPALIDHLSKNGQRTLSQSPTVTLETDESCAPAAIFAQWDNGGLFHDPDEFINDVLAALKEETAPQEETTDE